MAKFSGEQIGNVHYGFVGRLLFSSEILLLAGGLANVLSSESNDTLSELKELCDKYYCDQTDDVKYVKKGISYFDTCIWK